MNGQTDKVNPLLIYPTPQNTTTTHNNFDCRG